MALALAGAAGSLLMPFYSAYPFVGQVFVLMAFVAVVLGTLGNVIGALIASLMMGVAESLGIQFVGADSGLIVVFAMLLLTLAVQAERPWRREGALMQDSTLQALLARRRRHRPDRPAAWWSKARSRSTSSSASCCSPSSASPGT